MSSAWYAVKIAPRREIETEKSLRSILHVDDVYCPVETYSVRLRMKRHPIVRARPLTPGYIFVQTSAPLALRDVRGVLDVVRSAGSDVPAPIRACALHEIKLREAEIAMRLARRTDRSKRSIRKGSTIKVGDRLTIPHLAIDVRNAPVENIHGGRVESSFGGMRLSMPLAEV